MFQEGFRASVFVVALILACVVMCDATDVRLHSRRQGEMGRRNDYSQSKLDDSFKC